MSWQEDAPWARLHGAGETQRHAGISKTSVQPARQSRKQDTGVYGLVLKISAISTADLCEQIQLLEGVPETYWYAAARRRRLALAELRLVVPPMNTSVLDAISNIDRDWIEQHPGARCYIRPFIPGEVSPDMLIDANHTLVVKMFPGARMRLPIKLYREYQTPLTEIVHVHTRERLTVAESGAVLPARGTRRPIWEALASGQSSDLLEAGFAVERKAGRR